MNEINLQRQLFCRAIRELFIDVDSGVINAYVFLPFKCYTPRKNYDTYGTVRLQTCDKPLLREKQVWVMPANLASFSVESYKCIGKALSMLWGKEVEVKTNDL
jgi:hypothetical protein